MNICKSSFNFNLLLIFAILLISCFRVEGQPTNEKRIGSYVGQTKIHEFLARGSNRQSKKTDELIELLARVSNQQVADDFLLKLKE